jgi:hypothetical protein
VRRAVASLSLLTTLGWTAVALACPVCAQRDDGGWLAQVGLGAFVLSPWIVALCVGLYIRRGVRAPGRSEMPE